MRVPLLRAHLAHEHHLARLAPRAPFIQEVRAGDDEIQSFGMAMDAADAQGGTIGEFLIELARTGLPAALAGAIGAWLRLWPQGKGKIVLTFEVVTLPCKEGRCSGCGERL
jgi:hypothetical protein